MRKGSPALRIPIKEPTGVSRPELQKSLDKLLIPLDDRIVRKEWGWKPEYNQEQIMDEFLKEMKKPPRRYL